MRFGVFTFLLLAPEYLNRNDNKIHNAKRERAILFLNIDNFYFRQENSTVKETLKF